MAGAEIKNWQGENKLCLVGDTLCLQLAADSIAEESAERAGEGPLLYKAFGPLSHNKPFVVAPLNEKSTAANMVGHIQSIHSASHRERTQDTAAPKAPAKVPSVKGSWVCGLVATCEWVTGTKINSISKLTGPPTCNRVFTVQHAGEGLVMRTQIPRRLETEI